MRKQTNDKVKRFSAIASACRMLARREAPHICTCCCVNAPNGSSYFRNAGDRATTSMAMRLTRRAASAPLAGATQLQRPTVYAPCVAFPLLSTKNKSVHANSFACTHRGISDC